MIGTLVALLIGLTQETRYVASASVSFRPRIADIDTAEAADRLAANFAAWVQSRTFAAKLTKIESGELSPQQIASSTQARAIPKEMRLLLEFEDFDPRRAASVVDGLARVLVAEATTYLGDAPDDVGLDIQAMDPAEVPHKASWPRLGLTTSIGALVGMMLSTMLAAMVGWLREPIGQNTLASSGEATDAQ